MVEDVVMVEGSGEQVGTRLFPLGKIRASGGLLVLVIPVLYGVAEFEERLVAI